MNIDEASQCGFPEIASYFSQKSLIEKYRKAWGRYLNRKWEDPRPYKMLKPGSN